MLTFQGIHQQILDDETGELDVEGARMSAKTWTISEKIRRSCLKHPGIWWLICRYSGTETDDQLRPQFVKVCRTQGTDLTWNSDESCYDFPEKVGKVSKVFAYGLKTQSKDQRFAKVRGSGFAGVWNDQSEELPEDIGTEIRALVRMPGYPHQLIFSPNPPDEEHFLSDQFPDDVDREGRKYYRLTLYDNQHNLPADTIRKLEMAYPPTHAKHKSLILGQRGPNITGRPVYDGAFLRSLHLGTVIYDTALPLLEGFHVGQHHPSCLWAQRTPFGGFNVLGGIIGKRLFIEDFLPLADQYRFDWFGRPSDVRTCSDDSGRLKKVPRLTDADIIRESDIVLRSREDSNAHDTREAVIQKIGSMMRRRAGTLQAYQVTDDPSRFLMASHEVVKQTKRFVDSLEGSYVWDENYVSVGNKTVRQPKFDQWLEGWQRCQENIVRNFCLGRTDMEKQERLARQRAAASGFGGAAPSKNSWMS